MTSSQPDHNRARCPICAQWPTTRKDGSLSTHLHPWYSADKGNLCPGSGHTPHPTQLRLEEPQE